MDRQEKAEFVSGMHDLFSQTGIVIVTHYKGLSVSEISDVRTRMRDAGAGFKVTKNRLTRLALKGTSFEGLADLFTGPTAICYSRDPVAVAKTTLDYAKKNEKLVVVGAGLGTTVLDPSGVEALTKLPSLDELRARLLGLLKAPPTRVATVLQAPAADIARLLPAPASKLARVFAAYGAQQDAA